MLFVCDRCHVIENTALGLYWGANRREKAFGDKVKNGEVLCSQCAPDTFMDGSAFTKGGQWHNRFPRDIATKENLKKLIDNGSLEMSLTVKAILEN